MTVFGHADPTNRDSYNKALSGRRATAVYALLVRETSLWEELYSRAYHGDKWTTRHLQIMLRTVGYTAATESGTLDELTSLAVRQLQGDHALPATGFPDPETRKVLYGLYMDTLCSVEQKPFRYVREDFLSRGLGKDGKGDRQGCGEFNPVLVFSEGEDREFSRPERKAERDAENTSNRRVVVYMFPPNLCLPTNKWPCPTVGEGDAPCRAQFWPDGDKRRAPGERRREHLKGGRTFACLFYDRLARGSPCEAVRKNLHFTLLGRDGKWAVRQPYRLEVSGDVRMGTTTDTGSLFEEAVSAGCVAHIWWGQPSDAIAEEGQPEYYAEHAEVYMNTADADADAGRVDRELSNIGYLKVNREANRELFAKEYASADTSDLTVHEVHSAGVPKVQRA